MRKNALIMLLVLYSIITKAQFVNIPDTIFRSYLETNFPSLMSGGQLDTVKAAIFYPANGLTFSINVSNKGIRSLEGITYFKRLKGLSSMDNLLSTLPLLPDSVSSLVVDNNQLEELSNLPSQLFSLKCNNNLLRSLPDLPEGLYFLECKFNEIISLPKLPKSLRRLYVEDNSLEYLPELPDSLQYLFCENNIIKVIPHLPSGLERLNCENNKISEFTDSVFPESLISISCNNNLITKLPDFVRNLILVDCSSNKITKLPELPFRMNYLNCANNLLVSLPKFPKFLNNINCSGNLITNIDEFPDTNLILYCSKNNLESLPVLSPFLEQLQCQNNKLTSLPSLPESLVSILCNNNKLKVFPAFPRNLRYIDCSYNEITTFSGFSFGGTFGVDFKFNNNKVVDFPEMKDANNFSRIDCSYNLIESITYLPSTLDRLNISYNPLVSLPRLDSNKISSLYISGLKLKTLPPLNKSYSTLQASDNLISIISNMPQVNFILDLTNNPLYCIDTITYSIQYLNLRNTFMACLPNAINPDVELDIPLSACTKEDNCKNFSKVTGFVFHDLNQNNILDETDKLLNDVLLRNTPLNNINNSGVNGMYYLFLDTLKSNTWKPISSASNYYQYYPEDYSLTPSRSGLLSGSYNFAMTLRPNIPDLRVSVASGVIRPGFRGIVTMNTANIGTVTQSNITAKIAYPPLLNFLSSNPPPDRIINDTIYWDNLIMPLFSENKFSLEFQVPSTSTILGESLTFEAWVNGIRSDSTPPNNYSKWVEVVRGSFDPNDKLVNVSSLLPDYSNNDKLLYTIRFQNTGTDTAFTVIVRDELPEYLDVSTLEIVNSSHEYSFLARNNNILEFVFPNILLVDSATNEPASHGFIQFEIKPITGLMVQDSIKNSASIFFDYNEPIITPDALTIVQDISTNLLNIKRLSFRIYPNPTQSGFFVELPNFEEIYWNITDISGKVAKNGWVEKTNGLLEVQVSELSSGTYIFTIQSEGIVSSAKIILAK